MVDAGPPEGGRGHHVAVTGRPADGPPYRNRSGVDVTGAGVGRWLLQRLWHRLPRPPRAPVPALTPPLAFLRANRTVPTCTLIGHCTLLVQLDGVTLLIDPVFSRAASPFRWAGPRRHQPPAIALGALPHIDLVLISHDHYDHLDRPSVRALAAQPGGAPQFLVPAGIDRWLQRAVPALRADPTRVRAFGWGDQMAWPGATAPLALHFLPVQHWSNRGVRRNHTLWGSWAVTHPQGRFWYSGDLGYSDDPRQIGEALGPFDLAAISIGAYAPRWFMRTQHVAPDEAVQVLLDVRARQALGVHWGTFALADEPLDEPPRAVASAVAARGLPAEVFVTGPPGTSVSWGAGRPARVLPATTAPGAPGPPALAPPP